MRLCRLAERFEQLDEMSSRNAMIEGMAALFEESGNPDEIRKVVYLSEGILLPAYAATEFGVSEQLMARAIAEAAERDVGDIKALYRDIGDYGSVAEQLVGWESGGLTVSEAYDALLEIAAISGKGSIEGKVGALADLIRRLGPLEARYLLRVPLGKLRLGIGDPTIMDGLSLARQGDLSLRGVIENAYNLCGDMGVVSRILYAEGLERLIDFKVIVGSPIRVELAERAESIAAILKRLGRCAVEPKYDGFRCQVHKDGDDVRIFTRNLESSTDMFPEIVEAARRQIRPRQAIFEGEAVSFDPETGEFRSFQVTVQRKRKHLVAVKEQEFPLRLIAFDCLYRDGEDLLYDPFERRRRVLEEIVAPGETIEITAQLVSDSEEEVVEFMDRMVSAGLEGVMAKNLRSAYRAGRRTMDWIKLKRAYHGELRDTVDCIIVGYFAGRGRRAGWGIGSLLCAVYNPAADTFETITRVATGLPDQGWKEMKAALDEIRVDDRPARVESVYNPTAWVEPRYVTEVLADEITRSPTHTAGRDGGKTGYALRFPRIVTPIRADRGPEDATTVEEVKRLFDIQRNNAARRTKAA